jgi:hypothetical protein
VVKATRAVVLEAAGVRLRILLELLTTVASEVEVRAILMDPEEEEVIAEEPVDPKWRVRVTIPALQAAGVPFWPPMRSVPR